MEKNMGMLDRIARTAVGLIIAVLYFSNVISGVLGIVLLILGIINIIASIIGSCPVYPLLGFNTRTKK